MRSRDKIKNPATSPVFAPADGQSPPTEGYSALKKRIHRQLIERIDLSKLDILPPELVQQQMRRILEDLLAGEETPLSRGERDQLVTYIEHETFGLGPIEPLMHDPTVSDILVNGSHRSTGPGG